jgi:hypothetical protein
MIFSFAYRFLHLDNLRNISLVSFFSNISHFYIFMFRLVNISWVLSCDCLKFVSLPFIFINKIFLIGNHLFLKQDSYIENRFRNEHLIKCSQEVVIPDFCNSISQDNLFSNLSISFFLVFDFSVEPYFISLFLFSLVLDFFSDWIYLWLKFLLISSQKIYLSVELSDNVHFLGNLLLVSKTFPYIESTF